MSTSHGIAVSPWTFCVCVTGRGVAWGSFPVQTPPRGGGACAVLSCPARSAQLDQGAASQVWGLATLASPCSHRLRVTCELTWPTTRPEACSPGPPLGGGAGGAMAPCILVSASALGEHGKPRAHGVGEGQGCTGVPSPPWGSGDCHGLPLALSFCGGGTGGLEGHAAPSVQPCGVPPPPLDFLPVTQRTAGCGHDAHCPVCPHT